MSNDVRAYPEIDLKPSFPAIENKMLAFWKSDGTFEASVEQRPAGPNGSNEFVFYDGPPFANGLPHYGHLLTGYVKDTVPRYQTMRGRRVARRFGWDCHGLPAEMEAEKETGITGRSAIIEYGIERFNDDCRRSVLKYTEEWESYVTRQARWVDFANDYKTMDLSYMESVLWAFKQLHDKDLCYEGYRVLPFCWECETPLSNFETRLDDAYRDRQDPAVTVLFALHPTAGESVPQHLLVWTTTPWTLPSNLAIAVDPAGDYAVYEEDGKQYILGVGTVSNYERELSKASRVADIKGADLVGRTYEPLYDFFADTAGAFRILSADFITADEGTGAVHMAPGFGEDDQKVCEANGIPVICPVDQRGHFTDAVTPWKGVQVFEANPLIVKELKQRGKIVRHDTYTHSYPHCWRTDTPLIYKAVSSWFVKVTAVKERALELNQQINWVPGHVRDGSFGKWLEAARDWSITRNRFWGSPIPVWKSDDPTYPRLDVYGSLDELERDFGVRPDNLHRPFVDALTRPNPDDPTGKSTMRRVEDVLDCWFESGSMSYAQVHYPFENREWFENHFPADFIVEYIGQTRAWFYNMHVLATALFDKPAFTNCVVHGVLLGSDGRKMSKRLRNYPDPEEMFSLHGADAVRWSLLSSAVLRGQDIVVDEKGISDAVRQVILPLWHAWNFFGTYANTDGYQAAIRTDQTAVLDRYILAKMRSLVARVTQDMDAYDLYSACRSITAFMDALNNWYIRRSRQRVYGNDLSTDKRDTYDTLYTVLVTLCKVAAPLLPLITESIYQGLTADRSVHLCDYPDAAGLPEDDALVADMDLVREVCSQALSIRRSNNLRVRLPLTSLTVAAPDVERIRPYADLIADEVNVKEVLLITDVSGVAEDRLVINAGVVGPRLGKQVQQVFAAARKGDWTDTGDGRIEVGGVVLEAGEFTRGLTPASETTSRALDGTSGAVVLDILVTPELETEGYARDVIRLIQSARKEAGLHVADRIKLSLELPPKQAAAVERHADEVKRETLAVELRLGLATDLTGEGVAVHEAELDGETARVALTRA